MKKKYYDYQRSSTSGSYEKEQSDIWSLVHEVFFFLLNHQRKVIATPSLEFICNQLITFSALLFTKQIIFQHVNDDLQLLTDLL